MTNNMLRNIPEHLPDELFETLVASPHLRIERIVSHGHSSPVDDWYDQPHHEFVLLIQGRARLQFANAPEHTEHTLLVPGDYLNIPARCKHRVAWTDPDQPTVWLAVHYETHALNSYPNPP